MENKRKRYGGYHCIEKEDVRRERGREWPWMWGEREWWDIFIKIIIFSKRWRGSLLLAGVRPNVYSCTIRTYINVKQN